MDDYISLAREAKLRREAAEMRYNYKAARLYALDEFVFNLYLGYPREAVDSLVLKYNFTREEILSGARLVSMILRFCDLNKEQANLIDEYYAVDKTKPYKHFSLK